MARFHVASIDVGSQKEAERERKEQVRGIRKQTRDVFESWSGVKIYRKGRGAGRSCDVK